MGKLIHAIFKNGVFDPQEHVDLKDGTPVTFRVENALISPRNKSEDELQAIKQRLRKRLLSNKVAENVPRLKRNELQDFFRR